MMKAKIFSGLILVLFAAGCVNFGGTTQANVDTTNIITLTPASISVIPTPPIQADTPFTVTFEIKNQEKTKSISTAVNLFDWGVCKGEAGEKPELSCPHVNDDMQTCSINLVPQQTELIEIKAKAPSSAEIGGIAATCPMQWRAAYQFSTISNAGFNVVSRSHLTELQRAGKAVEVPTTSSNIGTGPVKAHISFSTPDQYVVGENQIQMKVQVKDEGEGTFTKIEAGQISIIVPTEWVSGADIKTLCDGKFSFTSDSQTGKTTFTNNLQGTKCDSTITDTDTSIKLINRQTSELAFNFKAPALDANTPQKSYNVIVKLNDYSYNIDGKQIVEIKP